MKIPARSRIHAAYCPDAPVCEVSAGSAECVRLDRLLDEVEDDRAHAEAEKLRARGDTVDTSHSSGRKRRNGLRFAADLIDPYEERDGHLVRKSDGQEVEHPVG